MALEDAKNPMQGASGPGKFAKRTDIQYQADQYGDAKNMQAQQSGATLASTPDVRGATNTAVRQAAAQNVQGGQQSSLVPQSAPTPLYAPTERPNEPVTNGINVGPGAGADALNLPLQDNTNFKATIRAYMPVLSYVADLPNTSPETRQAIRQLRDQI